MPNKEKRPSPPKITQKKATTVRDVLSPSFYKAFRETSKEITTALLPARHALLPSRRNGLDRSKIISGLAGSVALRSEDAAAHAAAAQAQADSGGAAEIAKAGWSAGLLQHAPSQRGDRLNATQKLVPMAMGVTGRQLKLNETLTPN